MSGQQALGALGVVLGAGDWDSSLAAVPELGELGYSTIWLSGAQLDTIDRVAEVARASKTATVGTAIVAADEFSSEAVARAYAELEAAHPRRVVLGLGGAHGPRPLHTLGEYLDHLDGAVPRDARLLSALGPRMLDLARERAAGAVPVLVTPDYTEQARARLGAESLLVVQQLVVLDEVPIRARDTARKVIGFLRDVEAGYARHFARMGFTDDDISQLSDRLVDALVAWGDVEAVAQRVAEHHAAGADQVAVTVIPAEPDQAPMAEWRELARALIG